jgi:uncharacterized membrane protein
MIDFIEIIKSFKLIQLKVLLKLSKNFFLQIFEKWWAKYWSLVSLYPLLVWLLAFRAEKSRNRESADRLRPEIVPTCLTLMAVFEVVVGLNAHSWDWVTSGVGLREAHSSPINGSNASISMTVIHASIAVLSVLFKRRVLTRIQKSTDVCFQKIVPQI